jgi:hypothetical protein
LNLTLKTVHRERETNKRSFQAMQQRNRVRMEAQKDIYRVSGSMVRMETTRIRKLFEPDKYNHVQL